MYLLFRKNIRLHPAAIRTRVARKIDKYRFTRRPCLCQTRFIIIAPGQFGFAAPYLGNFAITPIRREKCVPLAQRCAKKTRHQIQPKSQTSTTRQQTQRTNRIEHRIMRQSNFSQQIKTTQQKYRNPPRNKDLARNNTPLPHQIDIAQKFQRSGQFQKPHHHLHGI